jgi:membrane associated rhomboid family serine protease
MGESMQPVVPKTSRRFSARSFNRGLALLGTVLLLLWLLESVDLLLGGALDGWGIRPRTWAGLGHILTAPWVHVGFGHLLANTVPLLILGFLVLLRGLPDFVTAALVATLTSGLGIWLFGGARTLHLGASGVIFGLLGYLLARAYFERSWLALLFAAVAAFLYGGMLWGVLPGTPGVSWLGHLFGLLGGVLAAWLLSDRRA